MEIGLDIVEIARIKSLARRQPRFLARVFSAEEIAYCRRKADPWQHFAVRFAAKEAVWKALGRDGVTLRDISVSRSLRGKPLVLCRGRALKGCRISLSHSQNYAVAVAIQG